MQSFEARHNTLRNIARLIFCISFAITSSAFGTTSKSCERSDTKCGEKPKEGDSCRYVYADNKQVRGTVVISEGNKAACDYEVALPLLTCPEEHALAPYHSGTIEATTYSDALSTAYDRCAARIPRLSLRYFWKHPQPFVSKNDRQADSFNFVCLGCSPYLKFEEHDKMGQHIAIRADFVPDLAVDFGFGKWSKWLNRDRPGGKGDYETLKSFKNDGKLPCEKPTAIECKTVDGQDYTDTGDLVTCNIRAGGVCANRRQDNGTCHDYQIRVFCPN